MTKQTCNIYLVRHGESENNRDRIMSGHTDTILTEQGREQALETKKRLEQQGVRFDNAYSSTLSRAIETAGIIYGKAIPKSNQRTGLKERNWGELEGKPHAHIEEIKARTGVMAHEIAWHHKFVPSMESDHETSHRFHGELENIARENFGNTILVVGHGSAIRTTLMKIGDFTYDDLPSGSFGNAGYAELEYDQNGFRVIQINGAKL